MSDHCEPNSRWNARAELPQLTERLSVTQGKLVQAQKLASIGQRAAGVAHEINHPIACVFSNFSTLQRDLADLFEMLAAHEAAGPAVLGTPSGAMLKQVRERVELDVLKENLGTSFRVMLPLLQIHEEGVTRLDVKPQRGVIDNLSQG